MNGAKTIIKKELHRVFYDKKLIFSLFLLPAILIIGLYSLIGQMISNMSNDIEAHISSVYIVNAPKDVEALIAETGYDTTASIIMLEAGASIDDIKDKILNEDTDLLVVFSDDFSATAAAYKNQGDAIPAVDLYYNSTSNYSSAAYSSFSETILGSLQTKLLTDRFTNLELLNVFQTNAEVIVNEDKANGEYLAMLLPYFITFMLFAGAMGLGIDAITGEKERGTMASMLLSPIKRSELVFGKLVSLAILSSISAAVYAIAMIIAMPMMAKTFTGGEELSFVVSFSALQILQLFIIMISMVYLYVSMVSFVAVLAKTAKEAGTYVSPLYIVVLAAGMITMFQGSMEKSLSVYAIPVYGNALAIQNLMTNELTMVQFLLSVGGTLFLGGLFTFLLTKAFNSEKIMFSA